MPFKRSQWLTGSVLLIAFAIKPAYSYQLTEDLFELSLEELSEITINTVALRQQSPFDSAAVVTIIDRAALDIYNHLSLGQVIGRLPGVRLLQRNVFNQSFLGVRGFSVNDNDKHVLILIDGVPVRINSTGGSNRLLYESFPVAALERVELIQGQAATLYGSNAITAVINLVTRETERTAVEYKDGKSQGYTGTSFQIRDTSFNVVLQRQHSFNYWNHNGVNNQVPLTGDLSSRGDSMMVQMHGQQLDGQLLVLDGQSTTISSLFSATSGNESNDQTLLARLGSEHQLLSSGEITFRWDLAYDRTKIQYGFFDGQSREIQAITSLQGDFNESTHWLAGLSLTSAQGHLTPLLTNWSTREQTIFGQISSLWTPELEFSAGVNWQSLQDGASELTPQFSIVWKPAGQWRFKILYGESFRNADPRERFSNNNSQLGDPSLNPEHGTQLTGVLSFKQQGLHVQWSVFQQQVDQMIRLVLTEQPPAKFTNYATAEATGSQLNLQYQWFSNLLLDFSHTQIFSSKNLTEPDVLTKLGARYQPHTSVNAGVWLDYSSASKVPDILASNNLLNPDSSAGLSASLHVNIMLDHWIDIFPAGSKLSLSVNNFTNQKLWQPSGTVATNTIPWKPDRQWSLGFSMPTPF